MSQALKSARIGKAPIAGKPAPASGRPPISAVAQTATKSAVEMAPAAAPSPSRVAELRASANLMTLATGLFCILRQPGAGAVNADTGLPGVRISLPPGATSKPDAITISTFRDDGWLTAESGAALVRVANGPAQILVTIYQAPNQPPETAPRLQVLQLSGEDQPGAVGPVAAALPPPAMAPSVASPDLLAHIQRAGDVAGRFNAWLGERGSKAWIEGFSVTPQEGVAAADIEYQAVLGRGWLSPWVSDGKFCGSRGMALPLLGIRLRLRGDAAAAYACSYEATFTDGTSAGPVQQGEACESDSLAPLEAFIVTLKRRAGPDQARAEPDAKPAPRRIR